MKAIRKIIKIKPDELCTRVSERLNLSKDDVRYVLDGLIEQISDMLCEAREGVNSWVKISDDIAFKAMYRPADEAKGKQETVKITLEMSDYGLHTLEENYKTTQFYRRLMEKYENKVEE